MFAPHKDRHDLKIICGFEKYWRIWKCLRLTKDRRKILADWKMLADLKMLAPHKNRRKMLVVLKTHGNKSGNGGKVKVK
jgi:hypothetical protein